MKNTGLTIVIVLLLGISLTSLAQKNRTLTNGFSIKVVTGFPGASFGENDPVSLSWEYGMLGGLQLGNQWYINPAEKYGFGIMVNWLDVSAVATANGSNEARATADFTILEFGPIGTYAVTDEIAIDGYFNLRPSSIATAYVYSDDEHEETLSYGGFGITKAIGIGFRWRVLALNMEYVFGSVQDNQQGSMVEVIDKENVLEANSFRILLGVKF